MIRSFVVPLFLSLFSGQGSPSPRELELDDKDEEACVYGSRWVEVEDKGGKTNVQEVFHGALDIDRYLP